MNRTVVISILALTLVFATAIYGGIVTGQFGSEKAQIAVGNTTTLIGGDFMLVDQSNASVTQDALLGHYSLVTFGYTFCPDICPVVQQTIAAALDNLGRQADDVVPYLITIDPARDTVEVMAEYSKNFHPRLVALTGTPEQIAQAASVFRIFYGRVSEPEETDYYLMEHSSVIYVMDPDGKYIAHFTHATPMEEMVRRLRDIL